LSQRGPKKSCGYLHKFKLPVAEAYPNSPSLYKQIKGVILNVTK